ncbi:MAG: hypothetical protein ACEPOW_09340 [Bacteroidales bacterium]
MTFDWLVNLGIPVIVSIAATVAGGIINRKKLKSEIKKLDSETNKCNQEIQNLKEIKPMLSIDILRERERKFFDIKLEALAELHRLNIELFRNDIIYINGDLLCDDETDIYNSCFMDNSQKVWSMAENYRIKYMYILPKEVESEINELFTKLNSLVHEFGKVSSVNDYDITDKALKLMKNIPNDFEKAIVAFENDLGLNTSVINSFIEENKPNSQMN